MTDKQDKPGNPPAFPVPDSNHLGMSLRDWFAGQALMGLHANPNLNDNDPAFDAKLSYKAADAMLAERAKQDD